MAIINKLNMLKNLNKSIKILSRKMEDIKKNQMEILKVVNTILHILNLQDGLPSYKIVKKKRSVDLKLK